MDTQTVVGTKVFGEKEMKNRKPRLAKLLIGFQIFLSIGALFGGAAFILAPDGSLIQMPISHLDKSPFSNFLIPGLFLFSFLGVFPLAVAYSLWKQPAWHWPDALNPFKRMQWSWSASLAVGVIVLIWITVEMFWVPFGLVHVFYLIYGAMIIGITLFPTVRSYYSCNPA